MNNEKDGLFMEVSFAVGIADGIVVGCEEG